MTYKFASMYVAGQLAGHDWHVVSRQVIEDIARATEERYPDIVIVGITPGLGNHAQKIISQALAGKMVSLDPEVLHGDGRSEDSSTDPQSEDGSTRGDVGEQ